MSGRACHGFPLFFLRSDLPPSGAPFNFGCAGGAPHILPISFLQISEGLFPSGAPLKCGCAGGAPHILPIIFLRFPRICFPLGLPSNVGVQEERRTFFQLFALSFFKEFLPFGPSRMWACRRRAAHLADVSRHPLTDGIRVVWQRFTSRVEPVGTGFESGRAEGDWLDKP